MHRTTLLATLTALTCLAAPAAHAGWAPLEHDGFMLRLALGIGYENLSIDNGAGTKTDVGGLGAGLSIGIGGMVAPNFAINADLFAAVVVSPSVSRNGQDIGEATDTSVALSGLGVGITYYFMPVNIYVAFSAGIGVTSIKESGVSLESDPGLAINAMLGKEFWVSDNWGVGIAGQFIFANVPTEVDGASASFIAANLMFTATFN